MPARTPGALRVLSRPSMLLLHLAGIVAVVAAVLLGKWQVDAWQDHREDRAAQIADDPPVPLDSVFGADDAFPAAGVGRPVSAAGTWRPDETVLVSGKEHDGTTGFWVVTPLSVCDEGCASLPVVVGWSPDAQPPPAPTDPVEVTGWLQPGETTGAADEDPKDAILPALRIASLLQRVDGDLYGGYLILDTPAEARDGLEAVTPASLPDPPTFTALRNLLYGLEWWFFGLFAAFLWWRWSRDEIERARAHATPPLPEDDVRSISEHSDGGRAGASERIRSTP